MIDLKTYDVDAMRHTFDYQYGEDPTVLDDFCTYKKIGESCNKQRIMAKLAKIAVIYKFFNR